MSLSQSEHFLVVPPYSQYYDRVYILVCFSWDWNIELVRRSGATYLLRVVKNRRRSRRRSSQGVRRRQGQRRLRPCCYGCLFVVEFVICYFTDISCSSSCIQVEVGWWGRSEVEWLRRATWTAALELLVLRRGMSTSPLQLSYRPDFIDCHTHGNVVPKTCPFDGPCSCLEGICGDERTAAPSQRQRDSRVDLTNCLSAVSTFRTYGYLVTTRPLSSV